MAYRAACLGCPRVWFVGRDGNLIYRCHKEERGIYSLAYEDGEDIIMSRNRKRQREVKQK